MARYHTLPKHLSGGSLPQNGPPEHPGLSALGRTDSLSELPGEKGQVLQQSQVRCGLLQYEGLGYAENDLRQGFRLESASLWKDLNLSPSFCFNGDQNVYRCVAKSHCLINLFRDWHESSALRFGEPRRRASFSRLPLRYGLVPGKNASSPTRSALAVLLLLLLPKKSTPLAQHQTRSQHGK
ncbi:hypothetical protein KEM54_004191 [Ascosphaera aggregata]|nr:hypothetical protein KEM54_004191 [Ascosphaera aggregata]